MDSFDTTQRINMLAKDLLKNRRVASAQEAFAQAEATIKKSAASPASSDVSDAELSKELRQMRVAVTDMARALTAFTEKQNAQVRELESIRAEIAKLRIAAPSVRADSFASAQPAPQAPPAPSGPPLSKEEQAQAHMDKIIKPREPEQKPIELDKIFYFGNKKK